MNFIRRRLILEEAVVFWFSLFSSFYQASGSGKFFKYLGCYSDSTDMKAKTMTMESLTLDACAVMCQQSGYPYAGLQSVTICYCGMIYDLRGKSSKDCNYTTCGTGTPRCGGYLANDVYYSVDSSSALSKGLVKTSTAMSFSQARTACVGHAGDLACPSDSSTNSAIIALASNDSSIAKVWIGLYRKEESNTSASFYWTDETLGAFATDKSSYASFWADGEAFVNPCISLDVRTGKWSSTDCSTPLPFVCKQPPAASGESSGSPGDSGSDSSDGVGTSSKRLALFIVLPLFILCYGGSCILYCVHKIIKNCNRKKHSKMSLNPVDDGLKSHAPGAREKTTQPVLPYRPLSAGKRAAVFPAPQPPQNPFPAKYPMYFPQPDKAMMPGKGIDANTDGMATARAVQIGMPGPEDQSPPPKYSDPQDEKRARLLENASRESRMRREKEVEEGRPVTRPFTAPKRQPQPQPQTPEDHDTLADSHGSTTNLLGKDKNPGKSGGGSAGQPPEEQPPPQGAAQMSINEILKMKMAQKADKKRPRKIIAA